LKKSLLFRLKKNDSGASIVEFAIIAMLLFAVLFGIIEFGWIFNGYITLTSAAQEGVRQAVVMKDVDEEEIRNIVRTHARIFSHDSLTININHATYGEETEVIVIGDLDLLIAFPPLPQSIRLTTNATMRQEQ
jgi:Flp pilus assembly protein TadG